MMNLVPVAAATAADVLHLLLLMLLLTDRVYHTLIAQACSHAGVASEGAVAVAVQVVRV